MFDLGHEIAHTMFLSYGLKGGVITL